MDDAGADTAQPPLAADELMYAPRQSAAAGARAEGLPVAARPRIVVQAYGECNDCDTLVPVGDLCPACFPASARAPEERRAEQASLRKEQRRARDAKDVAAVRPRGEPVHSALTRLLGTRVVRWSRESVAAHLAQLDALTLSCAPGLSPPRLTSF